jgi:flavin-dependent dehydrogenase
VRRLDCCIHDPPRLTVRAVSPFRLDRSCDLHWLAVGDAAAVFDPIASQGIEKALSMGLDAAQTIARAIAGDAAHRVRLLSGK